MLPHRPTPYIFLLIIFMSLATAAYDGCVDLDDPSTWEGNIHNHSSSNDSFFVMRDMALCTGSYDTDSIFPLFIFNSSVKTFDCNGSTITSSGKGPSSMSNQTGTTIGNGTLSGFTDGVQLLNIGDSSPSLDWTYAPSPSLSADRFRAVAVDAAGNVLAAGENLSAGNAGFLLSKVSPEGVSLWNWSYNPTGSGDELYSVAVDLDGNYAVAGHIAGNTYVAKISPEGSLIWGRTLAATTYTFERWQIAVDSDNNYLVAGNNGANNWHVDKVDPDDGSAIWSYNEGITGGYLYGIAVDQDGNYVAAGYDRTLGNDQWRVVKLYRNGTKAATYTFNPSTGYDQPYAVAVDNQNNYVLAGMDQTPGNYQMRIMKITPSGSPIWTYNYNPGGNSWFNSVDIDQEGNIHAAGMDNSLGNYRWNFVKVYGSGTQAYSVRTNPTGTADEIFGISVDGQGDILVAGYDGSGGTNPRLARYESAKVALADMALEDVTIVNEGEEAVFISSPGTEIDASGLSVGYNASGGLITYSTGVGGFLAAGHGFSFGPDYVSLDSSDPAVSGFNKSANITLYGPTSFCEGIDYVKAPGYPESRSEVISTGSAYTPSYLSCDSGLATFQTNGAFSGYAIDYDCVDLSDAATFGSKITNSSNTLYLNEDVTLCPGQTYESVRTSGTYLTFNAHGITLDCSGSALRPATTSSGQAIYTDTRDNITVRDCDIAGFTEGIKTFSTTNMSLIDLVINASSNAIYLGNSSGNHFTNINFTGIGGLNTDANSFENGFTQLTVIDGGSQVTFPSISSTASDLLASTLTLTSDYVYLDSAAAPDFNTSARISLLTPSCPATIYVIDTEPSSYEDIIQNGTVCDSCSIVSCDGGVVTFDVPHFSGYAANQTDSADVFIHQSNVTSIMLPRYDPGAPGNSSVEGGNISNTDAGGDYLTDRWAAFYGNVTGWLMLGSNTSAKVYTWNWTPSDGGVVCVSTASGLNSIGIFAALASDIDTAWGFDPLLADSANNTFTSEDCYFEIGGAQVSDAALADTGPSGGFATCAIKTTPAPAKNQMLFCTNITSGGTLYSGAIGDYELLVPTDAAPSSTETYYFYLNLG